MNAKCIIGILLLSSIFISACNSGGSSSQTYSPPQQTCTKFYNTLPEQECVQVQSGGAMSGSCINTDSCAGFCTNICNKKMGMVYVSYTSRVEDKLIGQKILCACQCFEQRCS